MSSVGIVKAAAIVSALTVGIGLPIGAAAQVSTPDVPAHSYIDTLVARAQALLQAPEPQRNSALAVSMLEEAVKADNVEAMIALGQLLAAGDGVEASPLRAKGLLERALADGGGPAAAVALGDLLSSDTPLKNMAGAVEAYQRAADEKDVVAMVRLAEILATGGGVPGDPERATKLLDEAVSLASPSMIAGRLADLYLEVPSIRDPERAAAALEKASDGGNMQAALRLGKMLLSGDGIPVDAPRALALIREAVEAGDTSEGAEALGDLYLEDTELRDPGKAMEAYERAANEDNDSATRKLASLLISGEVPADPLRAEALLKGMISRKSLWQGGEALGDFYLVDTPLRDPLNAIDAYEIAVDAGNHWAMIRLAIVLSSGEDVPPDYDRARELLERSVLLGNIQAAATLGDFFMADTPARDPARAVDAYQKAIDEGDVASMITLAKLLTSGRDRPVDANRAETLFQSAIAQGSPRNAAMELGDLYLADTPLHDPSKAVEAYQIAAEAGNTWAMIKAAWMLGTGDRVEMDGGRAVALLERAITEGNVYEGADTLGDLYLEETPFRSTESAIAAYQRAIAERNPRSMVKLARVLSEPGPHADPEGARDLLVAAIAEGADSRAGELLGDLYLADTPIHDADRALDAYQTAAEAGNTWAMIKLADALIADNETQPDPQRAIRLFRQAAANGNTAGADRLGDFYAAETPYQDMTKAAEAYQLAVDGNSSSALIKLAGLLSEGASGPADPVRARNLLERAVALDPANAAGALADLYLENTPIRDPRRAAAAYETAVDAGDARSVLKLARMLTSGDGVVADPDRARRLIETAIADGDVANGADALGDLYLSDTNLRNPAKAVAAYERAVEASNTWSMIKLADLLYSGDDVQMDPHRAEELLERAVAEGNTQYGQKVLGDFYLADTPLRDPAKAAAAYQAAADSGSTNAMISLGRLLLEGRLLDDDPDRGVALLQEAISSGEGASAAPVLAEYYLQRDNEGDRLKARQFLEIAAAASDASAHLQLAEMASESYQSISERRLMVQHFVEAAALIGGDAVALKMMELPQRPLVAAVQELLGSNGVPVGIDGIHGPRTAEGIARFCEARSMRDCPTEFVSVGLLTALLGGERHR